MTDPIRVENQSINIIAGDKLRPGDIISARVSEILPGNRFKILWSGRSLTAESHLNLMNGQVIHARVESGPEGMTLRLIDGQSGTAGTFTSPSSAPVSLSPFQQLITAFMKASMPLPPDAELQRLSRLLGHARGRRARLARLQTDMVSRGADPSADFLEALEELLGGSGHRRGGGEGRRGLWQPPSPQDVREILQNEDPDPLLNLINNAAGKPEKWTYHRTGTEDENTGPEMIWKIRRDGKPGLALTLRDGDRTFEFLLEGLNPASVKVYYDGPEIKSEIWAAFRERLSLMNLSVDDTLSVMELSDGFTSGEPE